MPWQPTEHRDFRGGENLSDNPRALAENQAVLIENAVITGRGQIEKRGGMVQAPGSHIFPARIDRLDHYLKRDGTEYYMVVSGGKLSLHDGTELLDELNPGPYGVEIMLDKYLLVDGENFYESDGTVEGTKEVEVPDDDDATLDPIKKCTILLEHNGRLWATGNRDSPNSLYYSQVFRYDYFRGGTESDMELTAAFGDPRPPAIILSMFNGLLLGKQSGWWLIKGDPATSITSEPIAMGQGPVQRACIVVGGSEVWYIAEDGIRVLGQSEKDVFHTRLVSYEHQPLLNRGDLNRAVLAYYEDRILCFYKETSNSSDNDFCSVVDRRFHEPLGQRVGAWSRITNWPVTDVTSPGDGTLWAGLATGHIVRLFDGNTDMGTPITSRLWTPEYPLDDAYRYKLFESVNIQAVQEGQGSDLMRHMVVVGSSQSINNFPLPGYRGSVQRNFRLHPRLRGLFIQHRVETSSLNQIALLSVGERWRPLRALRPHEIEGTV